MTETIARNHSRFHFATRTRLLCLLAVVLGIGILGTGLALRFERAKRQRELVLQIRTKGGQVYYDYQYDESTDWPPDPTGVPGPGRLENLLGEDFLHSVSCVSFVQFDRSDGGTMVAEKHHVSDAGLLLLTQLPNLKCLVIDGRATHQRRTRKSSAVRSPRETLACQHANNRPTGWCV